MQSQGYRLRCLGAKMLLLNDLMRGGGRNSILEAEHQDNNPKKEFWLATVEGEAVTRAGAARQPDDGQDYTRPRLHEAE